jgi:hypothetical protein
MPKPSLAGNVPSLYLTLAGEVARLIQGALPQVAGNCGRPYSKSNTHAVLQNPLKKGPKATQFCGKMTYLAKTKIISDGKNSFLLTAD